MNDFLSAAPPRPNPLEALVSIPGVARAPGGRYLWPRPGTHLAGLSWALRADRELSPAERALAADVLDAYQALIHVPARGLHLIIRELRRAAR